MIVTSPVEANAEVAPTKGEQRADELGQEQFLTLLIAQLKHQDPLNPQDNTEFTAQMAQFSSLEQLFNVNDNLQLLTASAAATNSAQAMSLIGKEVTVDGKKVHVKNGIGSDIGFTLPDSAKDASIFIEDSAGNVIKTIALGSKIAGDHTIEWDGLSDTGKEVPDGLYNYTVQAYDEAGELMDVETYTSGIVSGVSFENSVAYIQIGDLKFMLGEVLEVKEPKTVVAEEDAAEEEAEEAEDSTDTTVGQTVDETV